MKRLLSLFLILTMILTVCGCAAPQEAPAAEAPAEAPAAEAPAEAPAAAPEASNNAEESEPAEVAVPEGPYVISGGPSGGNAYTVSACFADVWTRMGSLIDIIPGGGTANAVGVDGGTYELGWCMESNLMEAIEGIEAFDQPYTDISQIVRLDDNPCIIIVPADSDIETVADLKGKTIATPAAGTSSQVFVKHILTAAGIDIEKDLTLREGGISDGSNLYRDRLVDAIVTTTSYPNAGLTDLTMTIDSKFIPLDDATIANLEEMNAGYSRYTYVDDAYKNMGSGYTTIASAGVILVNNNMPEDVVYWLTKTINENWESDVVASCAWLESVTPEMRGSSRTPMHPGAERYYKEVGVR